MRTVTLLGLVAIADAINMNWCNSASTLVVYGIVVIIAAFMDVCDFFNNVKDK